MSDVRRLIRELPKSDLHNHLTLGASVKSLQKRYGKFDVNIPEYYNGLDGMIDHAHSTISTKLPTKDDAICFMGMQ